MGDMDEKLKTALIAFACVFVCVNNPVTAGELTLVQREATVEVAAADLQLSAGSRDRFGYQGKMLDADDLKDLIRSRGTVPEYIYIDGDGLTMNHLLTLARLGQAMGFSTMYHQKNVLKVIILE